MITKKKSSLLQAQRMVSAILNQSRSVFLENLDYTYSQVDGSYALPDSTEDDLLKTAKREIEELWWQIDTMKKQSLKRARAIKRISDALPLLQSNP